MTQDIDVESNSHIILPIWQYMHQAAIQLDKIQSRYSILS